MSDKLIGISRLIVLREIDRAGEAHAYGVFLATKDGPVPLPMQSCYRATRGLEDDGLVRETRQEPSTNGTTRYYFALTNAGRDVLRSVQEALA